eukprot:5166348-Amphidinium_carterae.1
MDFRRIENPEKPAANSLLCDLKAGLQYLHACLPTNWKRALHKYTGKTNNRLLVGSDTTTETTVTAAGAPSGGECGMHCFLGEF